MKLMKRSKIYKGSNVTFDPKTCRAYSYGWWRFVDTVNGFVVFNHYSYSPSTSKHQRKVGSLMRELGIKVDLYVRTVGLHQLDAGRVALENAYRSQDFESVSKIEIVFKIKMSQSDIAGLYLKMEEEMCNEFLGRSIKRQERKELNEWNEKTRKLTAYLENEVSFRDYEIYHKNAFGDAEHKAAKIIAVHQCVDSESMEQDVSNALNSFHRDGFGKVVFYV